MDLRGNGELFIRQVGPSKIGTYTCTVTSPLGTQRMSAKMSIVGKDNHFYPGDWWRVAARSRSLFDS